MIHGRRDVPIAWHFGASPPREDNHDTRGLHPPGRQAGRVRRRPSAFASRLDARGTAPRPEKQPDPDTLWGVRLALRSSADETPLRAKR